MARWKRVVLSVLAAAGAVVAAPSRPSWAGARSSSARARGRSRAARSRRHPSGSSAGATWPRRGTAASSATPSATGRRRARRRAPIASAPGVVWSDEGMPWLTAPNLTPDPETGIGRRERRRDRPRDPRGDRPRRARAVRADAVRGVPPHPGRGPGGDRRLPALAAPVRNPLPKTPAAVPARPDHEGRARSRSSGPVPPPDLSTPEKRGEYVLRTSACHHCHTPMKHGPARHGARHGGRQPDSHARRA